MTITAPPSEPVSAAPQPPKLPWYRRSLDAIMTRRLEGRTVLIIVAAVVLLYLVLAPVFMLTSTTFQNNHSNLPFSKGTAWSFDNYINVFSRAETYSVLGTTLVFALGSLLLAAVIALGFAWLLERSDLPCRNLVFVLVIAPSGMPLVIVCIAWSLLLNPRNGVINQVMHSAFGFTFDVYSLPGMIFVQALGMVPLTFLLIVGSLRAMNGVLEDAADTSGANGFAIFRKITMPLLTPALMAAFIYQFVTAVKDLDVPLILGLPGHVNVLSLEIFNSTRPAVGLPNYGLASTYGFFLFLLALAPLIVYNRVIGSRGRYATLSGRVRRPKRARLGGWRWPLFGVVLMYVVVSLLLPLGILVWSSLQPFYSGINRAALKRVTTTGWTHTFNDPAVQQAIKNTLIIGVCSATATMVLSALISWIIVRARTRWVWLLDILAFIPHAMPSIVLGLALLLIYLVLPFPVYGTIWIIVIGQATLFVSLGTRLMSAAFAQMQVGLEEAAATSGAPTGRTWLRIIMPTIRAPFANGFLLVFMASMQNLTLPLLLASPQNTVLSGLIYQRWDFGLTTEATVLCVVLTVITVGLAVFLRGFGGKSVDV
jgi:iron(III) transport system permease protein